MGADPEFKKVCTATDVEEGAYAEFDIDGRSILICHWQGQFYAIENECSHAMSPLCGGRMRRGTIVCPLHGARFNISTGAAEGPPATLPIETFKVKLEDGNVCVAVTKRKVTVGSSFMPPGTLPTH